MSDARLKWGSTPLLPDGTTGALPYVIEASADGMQWGNPQAVVTEVRSRLQDGSLASVTSYDNREATIALRVTAKAANDYDAVAEGEAALVAETSVGGYNTLSWTPSEAFAPVTVFDVVWSELAFQFDDLDEVRQLPRRTFVATLRSLPFGRDEALTTVTASAAPPVSPSTVSIDAGTSTTGWAASTGTLGTSGGAVTLLTGVGVAAATMTRTVTVDLSVTRIIFVGWAINNGGELIGLSVTSTVGGAQTAGTLLSSQFQVGTGFTRSWFEIPVLFGASAAQIVLNFINIDAPGTGNTIFIDQVSRTNVPPVTVGTNRQQLRAIEVGGSARTRASLAVQALSGQTLGDLTMIYTRNRPTGLPPTLRPWRSASSTVTADANLVSGSWNALGTAMTFAIPAKLFNEAQYNLVALLRATTLGTYTITWSAKLASSTGTTVPEDVVVASGSLAVNFPTANTWKAVDLGTLPLPTVPVAPDSNRTMLITLQASNVVVQIDEGWLFDLDNGALSWVNTATVTRLEVRTADLRLSRPSFWVGYTNGGTATGLVRGDWRVVSYGTHTFEAGDVEVFTVTTGTLTSVVMAMYYRSWQHNAREAA